MSRLLWVVLVFSFPVLYGTAQWYACTQVAPPGERFACWWMGEYQIEREQQQ